MDNLEIQVTQTNGTLSANFDEIRNALKTQMSAYTNMVVAEDEVTDAKKDLAFLRKLRKSLDDRRKEIKKSFLQPYDDFEEEVKSLLAEIDAPIEQIDTQIKMFQEEKAAEKLEHCKEIYSEMIGDYEEFLPFDSVQDKKWTNLTYSDTDIRYDISEKISKVKSDLAVIDGLNSEIKEDVVKTYKASGNDLAKAVARNSQYIADKAKIEAQTNPEPEFKSAEVKPEPESMGALNDMVEMIQTVKIIISKADLQLAKNALDFNEISYRVEGE